ncbi:MAG: hypothetical protein AAB425_10585, partial [Bdellovibrionota bacterium]
ESIDRRMERVVHIVCLKKDAQGAISAMVRSYLVEGRMINDPSKSDMIESKKTSVFVSGIKAQIPAIAQAFATRVNEIHDAATPTASPPAHSTTNHNGEASAEGQAK